MKAIKALILLLVGFFIHIAFVQFDLYKKRSLMAAFDKAWNARQIDDVMVLMSSHPIFYTSSYSPHATTPEEEGEYRGREAVKAAFLDTMKSYPQGKWESGGEAIIAGNRAAQPFVFHNFDKEGKPYTVRGYDIWTFEGNKLAVKDGYRKFTTSAE